MSTIAELVVKVSANAGPMRKELEASKRHLKRFDKDMPSLIPDNAGTIMAGFGAAVAVAAGKAIKLSAALEMNKISFTTMLGSAQEADLMLNKLASLAAGSPFGFDELVESSKKMLGLGVAAQNVVPWLTIIGDTVSAFGGGTAQVQSISDAFAKMLAQGTMAADQMNRLSDAGVPGWKLLAEVLNVDVATAMKMAEQKSIDTGAAIQGMMSIMATRYAGSMQKASNTVTGQLSNMGDVATQIATKMGTSISKGLDLTSALGKANKQLDEFSQKIDNVGITKAMTDLIPDQAIVASMTAITAYSASRFIPAMAAMRNAFLQARIAAIAFNASLGPLGWAVVGLTAVGTELYLQSQKTGNQLQMLNDAIDQEAGYMAGASEEAETLTNRLREVTGAAKIAENQLAKVIGMADFRRSEDTNILPPIVSAGGGGSGIGGTDKAWESIKDKAKQIAESIEREWVQTTKTQLEQLDVWQDEQFDALDKIKAKYEANGQEYVAYEDNKLKVAATYSQRRIDILKAEADEAKRIRERQDDIRQGISLDGLTGSAALYAEIEATKQAKIKAIQDAEFSAVESAKLIAEVEAQAQQQIRDAYQTTADIKADIDAAYRANSLTALQAALTAENAIRLNDYTAQQSMMETWQAAYLAAHSTTAQLMSDLYARAFNGLSTSLSDIFTMTKSVGDAFTALGQSLWKIIADHYAKQIAGMITVGLFGEQEDKKRIAAAAATGTTTVAAYTAATTAATAYYTAKTTAATTSETAIATLAATTLAAMTTASVAAGMAIAAAWAPAAAMVSLATFGANSAPAIAGITATNAVSMGFAIPKLANGGITTGPSLAMIGEGRYQEAVLPLNKKAFEKMGLTGGSGESGPSNHLTIHINALDGKSVERWLESSGGRKIERYFAGRVRSFAPAGV